MSCGKLHGDLTKEEVESIPLTRAALLEHKHVRQAWFTRHVSTLAFERLFALSGQVARARLLSLASKGAQAWMQATPDKGLRMSSLSVLIACRRALGLPLPFSNRLSRVHCTTCPGRPEIDEEGYHLSVCKAHGAATHLHNCMNGEVLKMHGEVNKYASLEVGGLFPNDNPRPDGVVRAGSTVLIIDTSVRTPLKADLVARAAASEGYAASAGEADKDRIYDTPCKQFGYDFLPAVFESFGAIGHRLAGHIQHLENEYLNLHVEEAFGGCTFTPRWRERFSVALQNAMASKIIGHCNRLHIPLSLSPFDSAFPPVSSSAGC
jgi:hypothetical protein